jgi:serine/threonine protein kinase
LQELCLNSSPAASEDATEQVRKFLAPAEEPDELGRLGPYRVLRVLGIGGMGVVFEAEDLQLHRRVALKALLPNYAANPSSRQRFLREVQAAAAIEDEHVVAIYQVGEERGVPFLAMPLLKGESLHDRLEREGKLPVGEVVRIGREIAEGLAAAHEKGLIHRDIKPGNVWLEGRRASIPACPSGEEGQQGCLPYDFRVKILDFGLVRAVADDVRLTQPGAVAGTPAYMSPEQAEGLAGDARSDLFSLGCLLYRTCTGEQPFTGTATPSLLLAITTKPPRPPSELNPDVSPALADLVMQLLAKAPNDRPASAAAVARALQQIEADAVPAPVSRAPERGLQDQEPIRESARRVPVRRWRRRLLAAVTLVLLDGGGGLAGVVIRIKAPPGKEIRIVVAAGTTIDIRIQGPDGKDVQVVAPAGSTVVVGTPRKEVAPHADPLEEAWLKKVAALPVAEQVPEVVARLQERNPGWHGRIIRSTTRGGVVTELWLHSNGLSDITPLRALPRLGLLSCCGLPRDLGTIADLTPLKGMRLTTLYLTNNQVSDLSPLKGMPLRYLDIYRNQVADLSPLEDMRLEGGLFLDGNPLTDLSPLRGQPWKGLQCRNTRVADLTPLRGWKLERLDLLGTRVADLSPLKGMPLRDLDVTGTPVRDLTPLKGMMKLQRLVLVKTRVAHLSPLQGLKLKELYLTRTRVADLSPLKGMPLRQLGLQETPVRDLTPLKGMPLRALWGDFKPERDLEELRSLEKLETINGTPAAKFLAEAASALHKARTAPPKSKDP